MSCRRRAGRRAASRSSICSILSPVKKFRRFSRCASFKKGAIIIFATKNGLIKKTELMAYAHPRPSGIRAIGLEEHDEVIGVRLTDGLQELILSTAEGQSIRFKEEQVRSTGRGTFGVVGMRLDEGDHIVSMEILTRGFAVLTVSEGGYGKRTEMDEYRLQSRGGKGIITMKTSDTHRPGRWRATSHRGGPAHAGLQHR